MSIRMRPPVGFNEFLTYLEKIFQVTEEEIKVIIRDFHAEMQKGLSGFESSLKMIPSFVDKAKGTEKGKFIALDLGGTNFRVLAVELNGKEEASVIAVSKYVIDQKHMQGTGEELFDFIADCIKNFIDNNNISKETELELAFTFSFPVEQSNVAAGTLLVWTKGFTASGVVGEDVIVCLNEALKRKKIKNIKIAALANDTVGTLVAKSYTNPKTDIGVILGTGTNGCYQEKIANIKKWRGVNPKGNMIINMEWGDFDMLPITSYDKDLDSGSPNPGKQKLEKLVSGMFLGEILRLVIVDLMKRELVFVDERDNPVFEKPGIIKTEHMSLIEGDSTANLGDVESFLRELGLKTISLHSKKLLKRICELISKRSARIAATAISAVVLWMDSDLTSKHVVAVDGTLFEKYPGYKDVMEIVFTEVFGSKSKNITLELAKDGSGKGAAIIAAVAASSEK